MSYSRFAFALYLLATTVMIQTVLGADPLLHFCTSNQNFTANGPYDTSFNRLMGFFYSQAPIRGFALGSLGLERERPYGLAMCRADVSVSDCRTCIVGASTEIRKRCPYNKGAIIWYDQCLLKYSNEDFIGKLDNKNKFYLLNVQNVSDGIAFNGKVKELLTQLASEASTSRKMYADGELEFEGSKKLYGLTQCTRDLSAADCKRCIDGAISELPSCCSGKEGGRVVGGSCSIRYETYPFVNA